MFFSGKNCPLCKCLLLSRQFRPIYLSKSINRRENSKSKNASNDNETQSNESDEPQSERLADVSATLNAGEIGSVGVTNDVGIMSDSSGSEDEVGGVSFDYVDANDASVDGFQVVPNQPTCGDVEKVAVVHENEVAANETVDEGTDNSQVVPDQTSQGDFVNRNEDGEENHNDIQETNRDEDDDIPLNYGMDTSDDEETPPKRARRSNRKVKSTQKFSTSVIRCCYCQKIFTNYDSVYSIDEANICSLQCLANTNEM